MDDRMQDAWNHVAEGFASLGRLMKERFDADERAQSLPAEDNAGGEALRESFDRFVAAGRDVGRRAVDVARDDSVKGQAKEAATALNDAISATVDLIGREVGGLFGRGEARPDATRPADDAPGSPDPSSGEQS